MAASTGAKAWLIRSMPKKLVSRCRRALSSLSGARKPPSWPTPALLMTSVTSRARAAAAATSSGFVTSSRIGSTPGIGDGRGITRTGVDLARAAGKQRAREGEADAAVGAGDEGDGVVDLHGESPGCGLSEYDVRHIASANESGRRYRGLRPQPAVVLGVSYCWTSALRAAASSARPSALAPSARASCSVPTIVPATTLAVARDARGKADCTPAIRRRTRTADASRTASDWRGMSQRERGDRTAGLERREVLVGEIGLDERPEGAHALCRPALERARHRFAALAAGPLQRLDEQRVARIEVGVEAAVSEAGLLHDVGDADARVAVAR